MTGEQLKSRLIEMGIGISWLAEQLGMTQPALSLGLKVQDIKTGLLERICAVTGKTMADFYPVEFKDFTPSTKNTRDIDTETVKQLLEQNAQLIEIIKRNI